MATGEILSDVLAFEAGGAGEPAVPGLAAEFIQRERGRIAAERERLTPVIDKLFREWLKTQPVEAQDLKWEWGPVAELPV